MLLVAVLGMVLGLGVATSVRAGAALASTGESAPPPAGDSSDRAHNPEAPGQPPSRLLDTNLQKDGGDDGFELANLDSAAIELCAGAGRWLTFIERRNLAAQQAREGHGARGPPRV